MRHLNPSAAALTSLALSAAITLGQSPLVAHADRFGPPLMDRVSTPTSLYASPDRSQPIGPLPATAIVVVLDQQGDMARVPEGWVPASDVSETRDPWIAEVSDDSVSLFAYPDPASDIRRTAQHGDLLRVTGVSHGVGDNNDFWWATSEGYVGLRSLQAATSEQAAQWSVPDAKLAPGGWWAEALPGHVRLAPSADSPMLGELAGGEHVKVLGTEQGQEFGGEATWDLIDGGRFAGGYVHASLLQRLPAPQPTIAPPPADTELGDKPWIVIDRSTHTLTLLRNGQSEFVTYVSLGQAGKDTPAGAYTTWGKYRTDRMSNAANPDADHPYNLPNVPFVQYYKDGGYAIHGVYWHDQFGTDASQGCINLTWTDAAYLYAQTLPQTRGDVDLSAAGQDPREATPVVVLG